MHLFNKKHKEKKTTFAIKVGFFGNDADSDWKTMFVFTCILSGVLILIAGGIFLSLWTRRGEDAPIPSQFDFIDKKAIENVKDEYSKRGLLFQKWKETKPDFSDPSV